MNKHSSGSKLDADNRDPLETLAAEFADRLRQGENTTVEYYAARYPCLADAIRDLFPTIAAMEKVGKKRLTEFTDLNGPVSKQLGDYRIIGEIAQGGMGIVYEAEQVSL